MKASYTVQTNAPTRYEITASNGVETYLIGYSPRLSRPGLLAAAQRRGQAIIDKLCIAEDARMVFACRPRIHATVGNWVIGYTGRTQRDAIRSPFPYIED